jgi:predicted phosphoribosyltransferase
MGKLIEDSTLRDRVSVFKDRYEAGRLIGEKLMNYQGTDSMILAIPSGGVPVAVEVAKKLNVPMDVIIVRKLQIPDNPEAGFGAMGPDGEVIFNEELLEHLRLSRNDIAAALR